MIDVIIITLKIEDKETVEEYSKCDPSFIEDDIRNGNLLEMCSVLSIRNVN
jgi:hypothetical protein